MPLNPPPMPTDTPLVEEDRQMNWFWTQFFVSQQAQIQSAASVVLNESLAAQSAAIPATALNISSAAALYRINLLARITVAGSVSSSLTPTIRWTVGGVPQNKTYPAMTGNTTTTYLSDVFVLRVDPSTSLTYETAYATSGATNMNYSLEIAVERLS